MENKTFSQKVKTGLEITSKSLLRSVLNSVLVTGLISGVALLAMMHKPTVPKNAALIVNMNRRLGEDHLLNDSSGLIKMLLGPGSADLAALETADILRRSLKDDRIKEIVLLMDGFAPTGPAPILEITQALDELRRNGKLVYAYGSELSPLGYMLASHASKILLDPMGLVNLGGLSTSHLYYKTALDKLGSDTLVVKAGKYKSATEPFERTTMSEEAYTAGKLVLDKHWAEIIAIAGSGRGLSPADMQSKITALSKVTMNGSGNGAKDALDLGLVDQLVSPNQASDTLKLNSDNGDDSAASQNSLQMITLENYDRAKAPQRCSTSTKTVTNGIASGGTIAIVTLDGEISLDEPAPNLVTPLATVPTLRNLKNSQNTAAMILRIDSPGGDVTASEQIRSEVEAVRSKHIPVYASLSSTAASGAYWIASSSDRISISPITTTGSIGAFAMMHTVGPLLKKIGINTEVISTGDGPQPIQATIAPDKIQIQTVQNRINYVYDKFLTTVASGRYMPKTSVANIAEGRIWPTDLALNYHLADTRETLHDTIIALAKVTHTDPNCITQIHLPIPLSTTLKNMTSSSSPHLESVKTLAKLSENLTTAHTGPTIMAECLDCKIW